MKKTATVFLPLFEELTQLGEKIRERLNQKSVFSLNVMASPGAGKTSVIIKTIQYLKSKYRIGVIEGDIVPIDVEKIRKLNVPVVLAHTGGSCHLDSIMVQKALAKMDMNSIDLLIIENVGNLICPASFYLGTHRNVVIASVPEGDDKPHKYPTMFRGADIVLLNKSDYLEHEDFSIHNFTQAIEKITLHPSIIQLSCRNEQGFPAWITWIENQRKSILGQP